jgi:hypothetical protein
MPVDWRKDEDQSCEDQGVFYLLFFHHVWIAVRVISRDVVLAEYQEVYFFGNEGAFGIVIGDR